MKRNALLSALLLGAPLSSLSPQIFAEVQDKMESRSKKEDHMILLSKDTLNIQGKTTKIRLTLKKDFGIQKQYNKLLFSFYGSAFFVEVDKTGTELKVLETFLESMDSDGNVLFELVHEDDYMVKYWGFSCSSTFNNCITSDCELLFNKKTQQWFISREETSIAPVELLVR